VPVVDVWAESNGSDKEKLDVFWWRMLARRLARLTFHGTHTLCSAGCGWWLVLICYEKKVLLVGWWLMTGANLHRVIGFSKKDLLKIHSQDNEE